MARTAIILVNWNGRDHIIECLESLMRLASDDFSIVIVDNGSTDGSSDAIRAWAEAPAPPRADQPPWNRLPSERRHAPTLRVLDGSTVARATPDASLVTLIETGANLGFAGANNIGMAFAARDPGTIYLWLLNNDTIVEADSLAHLVAKAEADPDAGIIGATLLYYDAPDLIQGLGGTIDLWKARGNHIGFGRAIGDMPSEAEVEADLSYVMGASMFVRRALYDRIGGMSEDYFLYFEEADWARRLPPDMHQAICLPARVYHKEGGTIGSSNVNRPSDTSLYYLVASSLRYYARYHRPQLPIIAARMAKYGLDFGRGGDWQASRVVARAIIDAATGRRRRGPYGRAGFFGKAGQ